jgi:hypothetical protein
MLAATQRHRQDGFDMLFADQLLGGRRGLPADEGFEGVTLGFARAARASLNGGGRVWLAATVIRAGGGCLRLAPGRGTGRLGFLAPDRPACPQTR